MMRTPVLVVGAGSAGLMLACDLRLAGVDVTVVDKLSQPSQEAPGVAINTCSVELLDQRGMLESLRGRTLPLPLVHFALLPLDTMRLPERHRNQLLVRQYDLERALEQRAIGLGFTILRRHTHSATQIQDGR